MRLPDPLDAYIDAVGAALALPIKPAWKPAVRANLEITLKLARLVETNSPCPTALQQAGVALAPRPKASP
ncbi:hypothetical protein HNR60_003133 [Rhodopseudomonas rhenobacensis]|uniref:DUF4089 domain-containing protein n=1 Tax=Rhodopseudomonas rhenobacensis TaxID=87461 RepID=A0A7W7Z5F9_9BRAD|nr:hypothetical protein [Rhodopseudomonas rhenobacensis]